MLGKHSLALSSSVPMLLPAWRLACRLWARTALSRPSIYLQPPERVRVAKQWPNMSAAAAFLGFSLTKLCTASHSTRNPVSSAMPCVTRPPSGSHPTSSFSLFKPQQCSWGSEYGTLPCLGPSLAPCPRVPMSKYPAPEVSYPRWSFHTTTLIAQTRVQ